MDNCHKRLRMKQSQDEQVTNSIQIQIQIQFKIFILENNEHTTHNCAWDCIMLPKGNTAAS